MQDPSKDRRKNPVAHHRLEETSISTLPAEVLTKILRDALDDIKNSLIYSFEVCKYNIHRHEPNSCLAVQLRLMIHRRWTDSSQRLARDTINILLVNKAWCDIGLEYILEASDAGWVTRLSYECLWKRAVVCSIESVVTDWVGTTIWDIDFVAPTRRRWDSYSMALRVRKRRLTGY